MSVRAYRQITEPEVADVATFNLWHNQALLEQLEDLPGTKVMGGEFDIDFIELNVAALEELLQSNPFEEDITEALQKDIQITKAKGQEYILYHCY
jgi:hypothetical protein